MYRFETETLAWHQEGRLRMRLDTNDPSSGLASSVMAAHPDVDRDARRHLWLRTLDLGQVLAEVCAGSDKLHVSASLVSPSCPAALVAR